MTKLRKDVVAMEDFGKWSLTQLAREFGIARNTVNKRLFESGVESAGTKNSFPVYRVKDAAKAILFPEQPAGVANNDPDELSPRDRLDHYKAENEKVKHGKETRLLVEVNDARAEMATIAKSGLHILETFRDLLERDFDLDQDIIDNVEDRIHNLRLQWSEMLLIGDDDNTLPENSDTNDSNENNIKETNNDIKEISEGDSESSNSNASNSEHNNPDEDIESDEIINWDFIKGKK